MNNKDKSFLPSEGLEYAIDLLRQVPLEPSDLPTSFPEVGIGEFDTLRVLAPHVIGGAARLDAPNALAHMDPPTPWITWATALWNARLNQNLLHQATAPFAIEAEKLVIDWLTPYFGMDGGHMCPGSTLANLTAIWAARDAKGVKKVIASEAAHLSIKKAARILRLPYEEIPVNKHGQLDPEHIGDVANACLVLTAGTTSTGEIDPLELAGHAKWTHVDAAWGGPLRLSPTHSHLLEGIDSADSIAVSAHKWLFQPKDSALIMFRDHELVNAAISFGGGYLANPNIGVQGSRGAAAIPLFATLLAWGRTGIVDRIDRTMSMAQQLAEKLNMEESISLWATPKTGITVFRPFTTATEDLHRRLPEGMLSTCIIQNEYWLRSVAANPLADIDGIFSTIREVLKSINA